MLFLSAADCAANHSAAGYKQYCKPKRQIAVVPCLRTGCISFIFFCLLNLKICTALAVGIDNRKLMRADRERVEVIGF